MTPKRKPSPRKVIGDSVIFQSKDMPGGVERWIPKRLELVLCDFGEAHTGGTTYTEIIQLALYRVPEVFLHLPWSTAVDIWSLGCMMWNLTFDKPLFSRRGAPDEETADRNQIALLVALLEPPPKSVLDELGNRALEFINEDGSFKDDVPADTSESILASSEEDATHK